MFFALTRDQKSCRKSGIRKSAQEKFYFLIPPHQLHFRLAAQPGQRGIAGQNVQAGITDQNVQAGQNGHADEPDQTARTLSD